MCFVLASASPRRLSLLSQIHIKPDAVIPADINEDPIPGELPRAHALRLASEKCVTISEKHPEDIVLAADTVVGVGRRILPKAETVDDVEYCLNLLSGRSHRVFTGISVMSPKQDQHSKVIQTRVKIKTLSKAEKDYYIQSGEWQGKAGGYGIQGFADTFILSLSGSYSNVVGLPLLETRNLLKAHGISTP